MGKNKKYIEKNQVTKPVNKKTVIIAMVIYSVVCLILGLVLGIIVGALV